MIGCRAPCVRRSHGQGDVDGLLDEHPLLGLDLELGLALRERLVDRAAGLADPLAGVLARLRRQRADLAVGERERRAVAGVLGADPLEARRGRSAAAIAASASSRMAVTCSSSSGVTWTGSYSELGPDIACLSLRCTNACAGQSRKSRSLPAANRFAPSRDPSAAVVGEGQRMSSRAPPVVGVGDLHLAAVDADQAVDDVHAQAGAAADAVLPELGEHPRADLLGDPLALVVDADQHARERRR